MKLSPRAVLEIGKGSGFVSAYLKSHGINTTALDVEPELYPEVVGSVLALPFREGSYDVVSSFEVLEHLPYAAFGKALTEMKRVARLRVLLSLPDISPCWIYCIHVPWVGDVKWLLERPQLRYRVHKFDCQHQWEIGEKYLTLKGIVSDIHAAGLTIERHYRVYENPYHRFFILRS
jgi:ubiquinone/menaquinone biosynthesis C-methylase UbiE